MKAFHSIIVVLLQYIIDNIYSLLSHASGSGATMTGIRAMSVVIDKQISEDEQPGRGVVDPWNPVYGRPNDRE